MEGGWRTSSLNHLPEVFKRISSHVQDPSHTTTIIIPLVLEAGSAPIVSGCYCTLLSEASTVGQITVHTCLLLRLISTRWTPQKNLFLDQVTLRAPVWRVGSNTCGSHRPLKANCMNSPRILSGGEKKLWSLVKKQTTE